MCWGRARTGSYLACSARAGSRRKAARPRLSRSLIGSRRRNRRHRTRSRRTWRLHSLSFHRCQQLRKDRNNRRQRRCLRHTGRSLRSHLRAARHKRPLLHRSCWRLRHILTAANKSLPRHNPHSPSPHFHRSHSCWAFLAVLLQKRLPFFGRSMQRFARAERKQLHGMLQPS
jgi:hypothetical protein